MARERQEGRLKRLIHRLGRGSLTLLLLSGAVRAGELEVTNARLSLLPGDTPGAGYFHLHNAGNAPVILVGADSDAFESVEMHMSMEKEGMVSMHAVSKIEVGPGETLEFAPKGHHLMLMKRSHPLAIGDEVEVVLQFAGQKRLPFMFDVVSPLSL